MTTVTHYKIYCATENCYVEGYGLAPPTKCYNDTTHEVVYNSEIEIESITSNSVVIEDQAGPLKVAGYFSATPFTFMAAANTTTTFSHSFPFPVCILTCQLQASTDMVGDSISFVIAPNTSTGVIVAPVEAGTRTVTVSPTVIQYAYVGLHVTISDGTNSDVCGRICAINSLNSTVTLELPLTHSFGPMSMFKVTRHYVSDYSINVSAIHQIGYGKVGGSYLPAGTPGNAIYINNTNVEKRVTFVLEHLY